MKRIIPILLCLFLLACVPTPKEEAVVNKADGTFEQTVTAPKEDSYRYEAPTHWTETIEMKNLNILIDADIVMPETDVYPVQTIERHMFTGEEVLTMLNACFSAPFTLRENPYSMAELEDDIRLLLRGEVIDSDDETGELTFAPIDENSEELFELREKLAQCPAEDTFIPFDPSKLAYSSEGYVVRDADGTLLYLRFRKDVLSVSTVRSGSVQDAGTVYTGGIFGEPWHRTLDKIVITEAEAIAQGEALLEKAGLSDQFGIGRCEPGRIVRPAAQMPYYEEPSEGYILMIARSGGGYVPYPQGEYYGEDSNSALSKRVDESEYFDRWPMDWMELYVSDHGVEAVSWYEPNAYVLNANENVRLLPFTEIQARIRDNLKFSYAWTDENNHRITELHVKKIVLSCSVVRIANHRDEALLAPTWVVVYNNDRSEQVMGHDSIMLINAIDGSYLHVG